MWNNSSNLGPHTQFGCSYWWGTLNPHFSTWKQCTGTHLSNSQLDHCNALYVYNAIHRLQKLQNTEARLLTKQPGHAPITPIAYTLPIHRITLKICFLTFEAITLGPSYLKELLKSHTPCRALRSTGIPRIQHKALGDKPFCHAAPTFWNVWP